MNIYLEFSDSEKNTPSIEVRLTDMKPHGRRKPLPNGYEAYDLWEGTLICRVVTSRGINSDQQGELSAWVRVAALRAQGMQMPYHAVESIAPGPAPRGTDPETGLDFTEVQFPIRLSIKPNAWAFENNGLTLQEIYGFEAAFEGPFIKLLEAEPGTLGVPVVYGGIPILNQGPPGPQGLQGPPGPSGLLLDLYTITALVGGSANNLDGVDTDAGNIAIGRLVAVTINDETQIRQLQLGAPVGSDVAVKNYAGRRWRLTGGLI